MKKKLTLVLAVVMALTMCLSFASCGKEGNKLVVGVDNAFPPMGFVDDNGNLTGFDIELAQAVGKKLNYEVEIQASTGKESSRSWMLAMWIACGTATPLPKIGWKPAPFPSHT